jgi:hypothetical protein
MVVQDLGLTSVTSLAALSSFRPKRKWLPAGVQDSFLKGSVEYLGDRKMKIFFVGNCRATWSRNWTHGEVHRESPRLIYAAIQKLKEDGLTDK